MEFPRKVLDYHFPNADSHIDICKTDFTKYANKIDILTGGFPCQPFSVAGKRKGTDDERYLWGEMLRAIQEIKPKFVIAENVYGITNIDGGLVFQQVCLDLENQGYEIQAFIIPACAKNAPHRRDRCWFVAYSNINERCNLCGQKASKWVEYKTYTGITNNGGNGYVANTECEGLEGHNREWEGCSINRDDEGLFIGTEIEFNATNSSNEGLQGDKFNGTLERRKWECNDTRNSTSKLYQIENWQQFPTESPVCGGDDGIPTELDGITFSKWRAESIKGYGNAIVPQIAYQLFEIIQELNENN
jgi:DNA (cytosine-5)-methyltransferase 1